MLWWYFDCVTPAHQKQAAYCELENSIRVREETRETRERPSAPGTAGYVDLVSRGRKTSGGQETEQGQPASNSEITASQDKSRSVFNDCVWSAFVP